MTISKRDAMQLVEEIRRANVSGHAIVARTGGGHGSSVYGFLGGLESVLRHMNWLVPFIRAAVDGRTTIPHAWRRNVIDTGLAPGVSHRAPSVGAHGPFPASVPHPWRENRMNAPTLKRFIVTVELRGPSEVVKREWPAHLVTDADDAYLMTHSHLSEAQKDRVIGHNVVEVG